MDRTREFIEEASTSAILGVVMAMAISYGIYGEVRQKISNAIHPLKKGRERRIEKEWEKESLRTVNFDGSDYLVETTGEDLNILGRIEKKGRIYTAWIPGTGALPSPYTRHERPTIPSARIRFYDVSPIPMDRGDRIKEGISELLAS